MATHTKGSIIERHGAYYWRRRERGRDLPLEHLGRVEDLKTLKAAKLERDRRLLARNPVASSQGKSISVVALAALYDELVIKVAMKDSSARSARSRLCKYVVPFFNDAEIMRIDALYTQRFIAYLQAQSLARKSIDGVLATLSCLLDFARQAGYPAPRLDRKLLRLPPANLTKPVRFFTPAESLRIIEAAPQPWRMVFCIAAMLGLRCGEVLALRWCDIDFNRQLLCVRQNAVNGVIQTVKSRNSQAELPMPSKLIDELRAYEALVDAELAAEHSDKLPTTRLFSTDEGHPFTGNQARAELAKVLQACGIAHGGMHAFRHGAVTLLLDMGVPIHVVKAVVRHGRIETTQRYSHAQAEGLRDAVNRGQRGFGWGEQRGNTPPLFPENGAESG